MKTLRDYIFEKTEEKVYAVQDFTGAILNVFPTKEEADEDVKNWPDDSKAKVVLMNKSEVESE